MVNELVNVLLVDDLPENLRALHARRFSGRSSTSSTLTSSFTIALLQH